MTDQRFGAGVAQIRGQVPIVPTVISADGNFVATSGRSRDAHGSGHRLATGPTKPRATGPRMNLQQQLGEPHFVVSLLSRHRSEMHSSNDGGVDIRVRITEHRGQDPAQRHVDKPSARRVDDFATDGLFVVSGPVSGSEHLGAFRQQLSSARDDRLGVFVLPPSLLAGRCRFDSQQLPGVRAEDALDIRIVQAHRPSCLLERDQRFDADRVVSAVLPVRPVGVVVVNPHEPFTDGQRLASQIGHGKIAAVH